MKFFLLVSILILLVSQDLDGQVNTENPQVEVISSKWSKFRRKVEASDNQTSVRAQPVSNRANKNFERNRRVNDPVGTPDPNAETIDARSAALDKLMQESRTPKSVPVDGFMYKAKIRNASQNTIEIVFWEYQFTERANPANVTSRHFLCGVNIKPGKEHDLSVFSASGPSNVVSIGSLEDKSGKLFEEKILINRVEYSDGTIWQNKDWNYKDLKASINRAIETPWGMEMCRNL